MKKKIFFIAVFLASFLNSSSAFALSENITQINFTSSTQSINVDTTSATLTVQTQNMLGTLEQTGETNHLTLSSTSSTGQFSSSSTNWSSVTSLTMSKETANKNFYYRDSTPGVYTLTISVDGKAWTPATQSITIVGNQPTLSSILITTPETKINYNVGDSLDISGLAVTGTYSDNSTKTENITITDVTGFNSTAVATDQVLTVTVGGKTTTYSVNINAVPSVPTENIIIRNGDTIIYSGTTPLPSTGTINISDDTGVEHAVNTDSILGVIYSLSKTSESTFLLSDLQYYDSMGFMLKCITPSSQSDLCSNWQYVVNDTAPWDSIDTKVLSGGETVGIYFGYPYQETFDKTLINTGESFNAITQKYNSTLGTWDILSGVSVNATVPNPDDSWNPTIITSQAVDSNGSATLTLENAGAYNISISDSLGNFYYIPTYTITVNTIISGGGGTPPEKNFSTKDALDFLFQNKESSPMYMDWVAIAAGAGDNSSLKSSLSSYLKSNPINSSVITDNERRAMALMALDINPYSGTGVNYIKKITDSFDGAQFDDTSLLNDDIFALIVLNNAGYSRSDEIITKDINYIISKQSGGSWGSVDMTAAAVQALSPFSSVSGVSSALNNASSYLQNAQGNDGGWGNVSSSSWATQAMSALSATWTKNNKTVADYFAEQQDADGAVLSSTETLENRIWATAYAVPAMMSKPWADIMQTFEKPVIQNIDLQTPTNPVVCPKGDLFSTVTGQACTATSETNFIVSNIPIINPNSFLVKNIEVKKTIEKSNIQNIKNPDIFKKSLKFTATDPKPVLSNIVNNNLGASAGNASSNNLSIKGISQIVKYSIVSFLTFIGKGFMDLFTFIKNRV